MISEHRRIISTHLLRLMSVMPPTDREIESLVERFHSGADFPTVVRWVKDRYSAVKMESCREEEPLPYESDPLAIRYFKSVIELL